MNQIVLFDGDCIFCNKSVHFIIKRDPSGLYKFTSLQGSIGQKMTKKYGIPDTLDGLILLSNHTWYSKSSAALRICKHLNGFWKALFIFLIIPKPIRDSVYSFIANRRRKWFGSQNHCELPDPEMSKRFL